LIDDVKWLHRRKRHSVIPANTGSSFGGCMSDTKISAEKFEDSGYSEEEYKQLEQMYSGTMGKNQCR